MHDDGRYRLQPQEDDEVQNQPADGCHSSDTQGCRSFAHLTIFLSSFFQLQSPKVKIQPVDQVINRVIHKLIRRHLIL